MLSSRYLTTRTGCLLWCLRQSYNLLLVLTRKSRERDMLHVWDQCQGQCQECSRAIVRDAAKEELLQSRLGMQGHDYGCSTDVIRLFAQHSTDALRVNLRLHHNKSETLLFSAL